MTVFIPVAMPVSVGRTLSVMSAAIAANDAADARRREDHRDDHVRGLIVERGEPQAGDGDERHSDRERPL